MADYSLFRLLPYAQPSTRMDLFTPLKALADGIGDRQRLAQVAADREAARAAAASRFDRNMAFRRSEADRNFGFRQAEAERAQSNFDRNFALREQEMERRAAGGPQYGMRPIWGRDAEGRSAVAQLGPSGQGIISQFPEGFEPLRPVERLDLGTGFDLRDPVTGQSRAIVPKDVAGAERQKVLGKELGKARAAFPGKASAVNDSIQKVDAILAHPALDRSVGPWQGRLPSFSAGARDFDERVEQLRGKAFLEARQELKGGGHITDYEGARAEAALLRASQAKSEADFRAAMLEFRAHIQRGYALLAQQAGMPGKARGAPATAPRQNEPPVPGARRAPDGNWYVPDPNRPGKYLQVR